MIKVNFISSDSASTTVIEGEEGQTIRDVSIDNGLDGIVSECGGCCSCATCHVYVDPADLDKFQSPEAGEEAMLDFTASARKDNSRLGCQLFLDESLGSVTVTFPPEQ